MTPGVSKNRAAARFRWLLTTASLQVLTLVIVLPAFGTDTYTVGKPTKSGYITLTAVMTKDGVTREVSVTAWIESTDSILDKQLAILTATTVAQGDTVRLHGYVPGGKIVFEPQNGWHVEAITVTQDDSQEPHTISLGVPLPDQEALCSLSGAASGVDVHGQIGAGFVKLSAGGQNVTVPTQPGMPSMVVEQMLIGQLNQAGIPARLATPEDFAGGYETLPHDASVIWFPVPDTTGIGHENTDSGLSLDLLGIVNGALGSPAAVFDAGLDSGLWLDVFPSVFSGQSVTVRYAARAGEGRTHLDIYDVAGRRLRTLLEGGSMAAGALSWDGRGEGNALLSSGVYFVRLSVPQGSLVRRVVCVRE